MVNTWPFKLFAKLKFPSLCKLLTEINVAACLLVKYQSLLSPLLEHLKAVFPDVSIK